MDNRNKDTESGLRFVNPPGLYNPTPNSYSHCSFRRVGRSSVLRGRAAKPKTRSFEIDVIAVVPA
jgi:hypothetical protein